MTIEERAIYASVADTEKGRRREDYYIVALADHENGFREGYVAGATEQRQIDHEEWKKDMRFVNVRKQELIDKACKTFCRFCPHQCEGYPHDDCQVQIEFRKALGE